MIHAIAMVALAATTPGGTPADDRAIDVAANRVIRTLTLDEALQMAIDNNPSLKNIDENILRAEITVRKAWSILLPNLSANGQMIRNNQEIAFELPDLTGTGAASEPMVLQELWGEELGVTANMTLFNARSVPLLANAYDNVDLTRDMGEHRRNEMLLAVAAAFYQVHATRELVTVAAEGLANAREFARLSEAQMRVGRGTQIDVLRAHIRVKAAERELATARDALALAKAGLGYLAGVSGDFEVLKSDSRRPVSRSLEELTEKALSDRLDLKASRLAEVMASRNETETWLKWVPAFDVTYAWTWSSAAGFAEDKSSWRVIFGARWDLLQGGLRLAELSERESLARAAVNDTRQLTLDISEEVERNVVELEQHERNAGLAEEQVELAKKNHRLVEKQYEVGMATSLDLLTASTELNTARVTRVLEAFQLDLAVLSLNKAVGELLARKS